MSIIFMCNLNKIATDSGEPRSRTNTVLGVRFFFPASNILLLSYRFPFSAVSDFIKSSHHFFFGSE